MSLRRTPILGGIHCLGDLAVDDIALEGLLAAPMECLLDTSALRTRMSAELAPLAGIELDGTPTEEFFVAGSERPGRLPVSISP